MQKTALVTGASSGIGEGIAYALAERGYALVCSHFGDEENAQRVEANITDRYGTPCSFVGGDLSTEGFPNVLFEQALTSLGHIDVLINNAGLTVLESAVDLTPEIINMLFGLNYRAPLLLTQRVTKHMIEKQIKGSVVNTASTRGLRAYPRDGVYGGLKAALIRSTQSFALDVAQYGIRINCVAPGAIQVRNSEQANAFYAGLGQRIPLRRGGKPEDIGRTVAWLVSDEASYITGITLPVDGGLILPGMPEYVPDGYGDYGWGNV